MSKYQGWAVKLTNGTFVNDTRGAIGPALFATRRDARAYQAEIFETFASKVVRVTVTVRES